MILNPVIPELELSYISPDEAPDEDAGDPFLLCQGYGGRATGWDRFGRTQDSRTRPKLPRPPRLRVRLSSISVSIRVDPWFSPFSSPPVFHFSLITDHSALPPTPARTYDWGIRYRDDLIRRINHLDGEETHYALHDYYNVTAIVGSSSSGSGVAVLERYGYSAFGDVRFMTAAYATKPASDHAWDLLYKAQFRDIETGFYNYGYRYLSPMLGRWPSRDPIGIRGGINLYEFVENNGVNGTDILGLAIQKHCFAEVWGGHRLGREMKEKLNQWNRDYSGSCNMLYLSTCGANLDGRPIWPNEESRAAIRDKHQGLPTDELMVDHLFGRIKAAERNAPAQCRPNCCDTVTVKVTLHPSRSMTATINSYPERMKRYMQYRNTYDCNNQKWSNPLLEK